MPYGISNVNAVASSGKAIRSEDASGRVVWFSRVEREWHAYRDGDEYAIDRDVVEANVDHDSTDVETVPVDESPFGE